MQNDILQLLHFYRSPLGAMAQHVVEQRIRHFWPNLFGQRLLGLGYATPYAAPLLTMAERCVLAMPAGQGIAAWPDSEKNLTTLVDEYNLPFEDYSIDRVVMIHALENVGDPKTLLQEIWRVMAGNGQLLLIVPNRLGLWARVDHTPFGTGQPFSAGQLYWLLQQNLFTPQRQERCLYTPPSRNGFWHRHSAWCEKIGGRILSKCGGLLVIEARKEVYNAHGRRYRHALPGPLRAPAKYLPTPQ